MKIIYTFTFLLLLLNLNIKAQEENSLNMLSREIERLEQIKHDKQIRMNEIKNDLALESKRNFNQRKEIQKQKTTIANLTEELLILNGELSNIKADFNSLIEEINILKVDSTRSRLMIQKLENATIELTNQLQKSYSETGKLTDELKELGFENEILEAKNHALENMIESLLKIRKNIFFVETNFGAPRMFDLTVSYNTLKVKNSLAIGGFLSYKRFSFSSSPNQIRKYNLSAVTIGGSIRATVLGGNFEYTYIDPRKSILDNMKIVGFFNFGYSVPLNASSESSFNRTSINASAGSSAIINIPELATVYFNIGIGSQEFRNSRTNVSDLAYFLKMGFGVLFSFE